MIVVVGLSHHTAPVEVREAVAVSRERMPETLQRLRDHVPEAMLLSTCNRVEIYARAEEDGVGPLQQFMAGLAEGGADRIAPHVVTRVGDDAVRHAFRVAASLESMVLGEPQILGQVKDAYELAEQAGALGSSLNALRNRSLAAAKRVRTETGIGRNAVSVSHVAVELAKKIFGDLRDRNVLLVGAGKMSQVAARQLVRAGARATVLGGRTFLKAEELAAALGGRAAPLSDLRDELARADIVISGTGAPGIVITREDVEEARRRRVGRQRPLFIIDIAVPRDVEASAAKVGGVFLYDLDDLRSVSEANLRQRHKEASAAEALVDREVREFLDWQRSRDVVPLVVELRLRGDEIRKAEIEKARRRLGTLTAEQEAALDAVTTAIVSKLLHAPTVQLKEMAREGRAEEHVGLIRRLLGL